MLAVTATDLPRLLTCNGSRLMGGFAPPMTADDTVRNEGNAADWLVGQVFNHGMTPEQLIEQKAPNGVYITAEMVENLEAYLAAVHEPSDFKAIEYQNSYNGANWQVNGRADLVKYDAARCHLDIADLKYGWSIVEPEMNWTLLSHAFGLLAQTGWTISTVTFTIYQPRPHHHLGRVRSWTITGHELLERFLFMRAILDAPNDMLQTSEHCRNCPALAVCGAARKAEMNAIEASEKAFHDEVDNATLSFELDNIDRAAEILKQRRTALAELALYRLKQGEQIVNYGTEIEQTRTQWKDFVTPELIQGLSQIDVSEKSIISPAQAKKRGVCEIVVESLTERHNKGVKLVRIDANAKAKKLFNNPKGK